MSVLMVLNDLMVDNLTYSIVSSRGGSVVCGKNYTDYIVMNALRKSYHLHTWMIYEKAFVSWFVLLPKSHETYDFLLINHMLIANNVHIICRSYRWAPLKKTMPCVINGFRPYHWRVEGCRCNHQVNGVIILRLVSLEKFNLKSQLVISYFITRLLLGGQLC